MKNRNIIVLFFLFFSNFLQAQGTTCSSADPFCTSSANSFPAGVNQPDATITQAGNNYDCLSTAPNPAWYYLEIEIGYGWNGKHQKTGELCALGVYVWRITVRDEYSPTLYDYIGNVTLIR